MTDDGAQTGRRREIDLTARWSEICSNLNPKRNVTIGIH